MATYTAQVLDANGAVVERFEFNVQHDTGAANYAQRYAETGDVEVWQGTRRVIQLKAVAVRS